MSSRVQAAEAYIKALRTGERTASQIASQYLADDVVLSTGQAEISGREEVTKRITGQWPLTPVFQHAGFGPPQESGDTLKLVIRRGNTLIPVEFSVEKKRDADKAKSGKQADKSKRDKSEDDDDE